MDLRALFGSNAAFRIKVWVIFGTNSELLATNQRF